MGTSNILSSMAGGLTIIPGGIKSTTNILSGGKTLWANFFNALFLIAYVVLFRDFINMIPLCVLAAVLVHIGYGLCSISKVKHVAKQGVEELLVFLSTIIGTLCTDLLVGLLIGSSVKGTCGIFHAWQRRRDAGHLQAH
jgi:carbonic anhydrase